MSAVKGEARAGKTRTSGGVAPTPDAAEDATPGKPTSDKEPGKTRSGAALPLPAGCTYIPITLPSQTADYITVVTTLNGRPAGKVFTHSNSDGYKKDTAGLVSEYRARTVRVPSPESFAAVQRKLTTAQALILGWVPGTEDGAEYRILSGERLRKRLGAKKDIEPLGAYRWGTGPLYVARFKENGQYSTWRLSDVDIKDEMPAELRSADYAEWAEKMATFVPEAIAAPTVVVPSSSNRVVDADGNLIAPSGSFHVYVQTGISDDMPDRWATALEIAAEVAGFSYRQPRYYRKGELAGKKCGEGIGYIFDPAVLKASNRLCFDGPPALDKSAIGAGAKLLAVNVAVVNPNGPRWDTRKLRTTEEAREQFAERTGMTVAGDGRGMHFVSETLPLRMVVETEAGAMTIAEYWARDDGKLRAQADWRGSDSWNAILNRHENGQPFLYDNGENRRYELMRPETVEDAITMVRAAPGDWRPAVAYARLKPSEVRTVIQDVHDRNHSGPGIRDLKKDWEAYQEEAASVAAQSNLKSKAGARLLLRWDETNLTLMLRKTETAMLDDPKAKPLLRHGDMYTRAVTRPPMSMQRIDDPEAPPPDVTRLQHYDDTAMTLRIEDSVCFHSAGQKGGRAIRVPRDMVRMMLNNPDPKAPVIHGLVTHPVVTPSGVLLEREGLHAAHGLYLAFGGAKFPEVTALAQEDAAAACAELRRELFEDFEFDEPLDGDVAVAFLLTTLLRKSMEKAPGFYVNAPMQGCGKTTLARMVHLTATGRDLPVADYTADQAEQGKVMTAMLLQSLSMVCFDNVPDGYTMRSPVLAKVLSSDMYQTRILGISKEVELPTNTTFCATGNNISVDVDLTRRMLEVRLTASSPRPERRKFKHTNPVRHCLRNRGQWIATALGVVRGYYAAGAPDVCEGVGSGFELWDLLVRQPLRWAGCADLIDKFEIVRGDSPDVQRMVALLVGLLREFGGKEFGTRDVIKIAEFPNCIADSSAWSLWDALQDDPPKNGTWNANVMRPRLQRLQQWIDVGEGRLYTLKRRSLEGRARYRVEGEDGPIKMAEGAETEVLNFDPY